MQITFNIINLYGEPMSTPIKGTLYYSPLINRLIVTHKDGRYQLISDYDTGCRLHSLDEEWPPLSGLRAELAAYKKFYDYLIKHNQDVTKLLTLVNCVNSVLNELRTVNPPIKHTPDREKLTASRYLAYAKARREESEKIF